MKGYQRTVIMSSRNLEKDVRINEGNEIKGGKGDDVRVSGEIKHWALEGV